MKQIRLLKAEEIDIRVGHHLWDNIFSFLLYKDARCDMSILDETFGICGWKRRHSVINNNLFCLVSIWDENKKQWIEKEDVGTQSMTEKEKGEASDSFKRACVNVGIGRELYSAPNIIINFQEKEITVGQNGKKKLKSFIKLFVKEIQYSQNNSIENIVIVDNNNIERYSFKQNNFPLSKTETKLEQPKNSDPQQQRKIDNKISEPQRKRLFAISGGNTAICRKVITHFGYEKSEDIKLKDYEEIANEIKKLGEK